MSMKYVTVFPLRSRPCPCWAGGRAPWSSQVWWATGAWGVSGSWPSGTSAHPLWLGWRTHGCCLAGGNPPPRGTQRKWRCETYCTCIQIQTHIIIHCAVLWLMCSVRDSHTAWCCGSGPSSGWYQGGSTWSNQPGTDNKHRHLEEETWSCKWKHWQHLIYCTDPASLQSNDLKVHLIKQ